jgi:hypothetical protein
MINPYESSNNASAVNRPRHVRKLHRDDLSLISTVLLISISPLALLTVHFFAPINPRIPPGVWPEKTTVDHVFFIGLAHLIFTTASLVMLWRHDSKPAIKVILTLIAIGSIPAIWFGCLLVTLEKTNKWL